MEHRKGGLEQWRIQDLPEEGAPTLGGGGHQDMILLKFPENCMKLKKIRPLGEGGGGARPLGPPYSATGESWSVYKISLQWRIQDLLEGAPTPEPAGKGGTNLLRPQFVFSRKERKKKKRIENANKKSSDRPMHVINAIE